MMASVNSHHGERPHALGHERGPDRPACPERRDEETRTRSRLARGPHFGLDAFCGRPPDCDGTSFPAVSHGHPGFQPHCNLMFRSSKIPGTLAYIGFRNTSFALLFLESRSAVKLGVAEFSVVLSSRRPDKPSLPARRPCG